MAAYRRNLKVRTIAADTAFRIEQRMLHVLILAVVFVAVLYTVLA
jgi:hypothetical protein